MSDVKKMELIRNLVDNLPVLRAKAGISQEILAKMLGLSRQTMTMIECGTRKLTWTNYLAIVHVFSLNENIRNLMIQLNVMSEKLEEEYTETMYKS